MEPIAALSKYIHDTILFDIGYSQSVYSVKSREPHDTVYRFIPAREPIFERKALINGILKHYPGSETAEHFVEQLKSTDHPVYSQNNGVYWIVVDPTLALQYVFSSYTLGTREYVKAIKAKYDVDLTVDFVIHNNDTHLTVVDINNNVWTLYFDEILMG